MVPQMTCVIEAISKKLGKVLAAGAEQGRKFRGHAVVARRKLAELHETMGRLVPQIRHWLRTGFVASGKVINLHIPELFEFPDTLYLRSSSSEPVAEEHEPSPVVGIGERPAVEIPAR
jgi:hypothetical protein